MSNLIITRDQIKQGDTLSVTYVVYGALCNIVGKAHHQDADGDWWTEGETVDFKPLTNSKGKRKNETIYLLGRPFNDAPEPRHALEDQDEAHGSYRHHIEQAERHLDEAEEFMAGYKTGERAQMHALIAQAHATLALAYQKEGQS